MFLFSWPIFSLRASFPPSGLLILTPHRRLSAQAPPDPTPPFPKPQPIVGVGFSPPFLLSLSSPLFRAPTRSSKSFKNWHPPPPRQPPLLLQLLSLPSVPLPPPPPPSFQVSHRPEGEGERPDCLSPPPPPPPRPRLPPPSSS